MDKLETPCLPTSDDCKKAEQARETTMTASLQCRNIVKDGNHEGLKKAQA